MATQINNQKQQQQQWRLSDAAAARRERYQMLKLPLHYLVQQF
jgi:hypothetical protein